MSTVALVDRPCPIYGLARVLADFPDDVLYSHPVKMSRWAADREGVLR